MEPRKETGAPEYLRNEKDESASDFAQSLPDDVAGDKKPAQENAGQKENWQHRLNEELGAGHEEKDFTD